MDKIIIISKYLGMISLVIILYSFLGPEFLLIYGALWAISVFQNVRLSTYLLKELTTDSLDKIDGLEETVRETKDSLSVIEKVLGTNGTIFLTLMLVTLIEAVRSITWPIEICTDEAARGLFFSLTPEQFNIFASQIKEL